MPNLERRLVWNAGFGTGVRLMDEQHQTLFDLINTLGEHLVANAIDTTELMQDMEAAVSYSLFHFVSEESLAYRSGVTTGMEAHLAAHNAFRTDVAALRVAAERDPGQRIDAARRMHGYLCDWYTAHILSTDMELATRLHDTVEVPAREEAVPSHGLAIGVLDADPALQANIVAFMNRVGHRAAALDGTESFLRRMAGGGPGNPSEGGGIGVLIIDPDTPERDGLDLLARYGGREDLAIVVLTSHSSTDERIAAYRRGADAILAKPVDLRELLAVVDHIGQRIHPDAESHPDTWRLSVRHRRLAAPNGRVIDLDEAQAGLLQLFVPGRRTLQGPELAKTVDAGAPGTSADARILARLIALRDRVQEASGLAIPIRSIHGVGYLFSAPLIAVG